MEDAEKIIKAKVQLILNQPFFATLALGLQYLPDTSIKTTCTNGVHLKYNPAYIEKLSIDELAGVFAHEVMHNALFHNTRRQYRDKAKWNKATDYAINPMLIESGFLLPEGYLDSDLYLNRSAEEIYNLMPVSDDEKQDENGDEDSNQDTIGSSHQDKGMGEVEDLPSDMDTHEAESNMRQVLVQASMTAQRQGKMPESLQRLVDQMLRPRHDWKQILAQYLSEIARNDYSWKKPARRLLHCGIYIPSLESLETGKIILIVDTSSSIKDQLINQFTAEVQDIANAFSIGLMVIYVDTTVQHVQEIAPDEHIQLKPKGGGGTDFKPGFVYIDKNNLDPKAVVYLTDGECNSFPIEPDYSVIWAQFGDYSFKPPFGQVIQVEQS